MRLTPVLKLDFSQIDPDYYKYSSKALIGTISEIAIGCSFEEVKTSSSYRELYNISIP